ncbi:MAG: hypothetical protein WA755_14035 [Candidatus Acidiferrales bacterium]
MLRPPTVLGDGHDKSRTYINSGENFENLAFVQERAFEHGRNNLGLSIGQKGSRDAYRSTPREDHLLCGRQLGQPSQNQFLSKVFWSRGSGWRHRQLHEVPHLELTNETETEVEWYMRMAGETAPDAIVAQPLLSSSYFFEKGRRKFCAQQQQTHAFYDEVRVIDQPEKDVFVRVMEQDRNLILRREPGLISS